jgi:hypothetical protein
MMQNCQILVLDPMLAPFVCAEGWICFFPSFSAPTANTLLRVLKSNTFLLPELLVYPFVAIPLACQETSAKRKT